MSDTLTAAAAEAQRDPTAPILSRVLAGRRWDFGTLDVRPSQLKRYAVLAEMVAGKRPDQITNGEAVELAAIAEEMLTLALPPADRAAFEDAPLTGTDIAALAADYFASLGVGAGESSASPASSRNTRKRSRRTSRR
ncbi:hypothetical protein [Catellatospora sp. NPDC049609]|uniref:hypothetical protein n=1 Tax=Catellatospora sp. NPDC049609 TaxID=3155505 RepID=UPI00343F29AB